MCFGNGALDVAIDNIKYISIVSNESQNVSSMSANAVKMDENYTRKDPTQTENDAVPINKNKRDIGEKGGGRMQD